MVGSIPGKVTKKIQVIYDLDFFGISAVMRIRALVLSSTRHSAFFENFAILLSKVLILNCNYGILIMRNNSYSPKLGVRTFLF